MTKPVVYFWDNVCSRYGNARGWVTAIPKDGGWHRYNEETIQPALEWAGDTPVGWWFHNPGGVWQGNMQSHQYIKTQSEDREMYTRITDGLIRVVRKLADSTPTVMYLGSMHLDRDLTDNLDERGRTDNILRRLWRSYRLVLECECSLGVDAGSDLQAHTVGARFYQMIHEMFRASDESLQEQEIDRPPREVWIEALPKAPTESKKYGTPAWNHYHEEADDSREPFDPRLIEGENWNHWWDYPMHAAVSFFEQRFTPRGKKVWDGTKDIVVHHNPLFPYPQSAGFYQSHTINLIIKRHDYYNKNGGTRGYADKVKQVNSWGDQFVPMVKPEPFIKAGYSLEEVLKGFTT